MGQPQAVSLIYNVVVTFVQHLYKSLLDLGRGYYIQNGAKGSIKGVWTAKMRRNDLFIIAIAQKQDPEPRLC